MLTSMFIRKNTGMVARRPSSQLVNRLKKIHSASPEALRRQWQRWLHRVGIDITDLYRRLQIYKELTDVVRQHKPALDPPVFFNWAQQNYIVAICLGIRRLSDLRADSVSAARLLHEINERSELVSRASFRALSRRRGIGTNDADMVFDMHVGNGEPHIKPALVQDHLAQIEAADSRVLRLVNKRLAHHAPLTEAGKPPTFHEVESALETYDRVVVFYDRLIAGSGLTTFYATPTYNWRRVFETAWLRRTRSDWPDRYTGPQHVRLSKGLEIVSSM